MSNATDARSYVGFSPYIAGELEMNGERFSLASLAPGKLELHQAKEFPAGRATLRITVDRAVDVRVIELHEGIDPQRREQPFRVVEKMSAVA